VYSAGFRSAPSATVQEPETIGASGGGAGHIVAKGPPRVAQGMEAESARARARAVPESRYQQPN